MVQTDRAQRRDGKLHPGVYDAREMALERLQAESAALRATNVIGINVSQSNYEWESHVIEFFALGTAVIPLTADQPIPKPSLTLTLNS